MLVLTRAGWCGVLRQVPVVGLRYNLWGQVSATLSMQQIWTAPKRYGPYHLGFSLIGQLLCGQNPSGDKVSVDGLVKQLATLPKVRH